MFKHHLLIALGSCAETKTWLEFAYECEYITKSNYINHKETVDQIGKMLNSLHKKWQTFK